MKKIIAALNEKGIFHVITAGGVETMPATLDAKGKAELQKYFGFDSKDFTVPAKMKDPFVNKMSEMSKQMTDKAKSEGNQKKGDVSKGL